jgi:hypothetical protein
MTVRTPSPPVESFSPEKRPLGAFSFEFVCFGYIFKEKGYFKEYLWPV